jgi:processing peptidase subunit alpha
MSGLLATLRGDLRSSRSMIPWGKSRNPTRMLSNGPYNTSSLTSVISPSRTSSSRLPRHLQKLQRSLSTAIPTSSLLSYKTLPNGIRVAGEETPGHFSALGVYINAGSRFERQNVRGESGVSHLLDRMAFKSTKKCSVEVMTARLEKLGGNFQAASSRETIMYQGSMFNQDVPEAMSIFADTILHPQVNEIELEELREQVAWEVNNLSDKPEQIIPELLHMKAYEGNTLGNPLLCPQDSIHSMTADNIRDFMQAWYTPERIVIAGAGMPFDQLCGLSEELFGDLQSVARKTATSSRFGARLQALKSHSAPFAAHLSTTASVPAKHLENADLAPRPDLALEKARYTGGELYESRPKQDFTHVYIAFESMSIEDEDIYALSVLQTLLGGGSSFSAGGPGKGMYSRLYSNVLNQHHAVDYCAAFHHCYGDSGLFGIAIAVEPSFNAYIPSIISRELESVCNPTSRGGVRQEELTRAKNQLKSSLMMSLESRLVEVEDLGRQVQVSGKRVTVEEMCEKIDQVDMTNLGRVARRVMQPERQKEPLNYHLGNGKSTVVAMGKLDGLPNIRELLAKRGLGAAP